MCKPTAEDCTSQVGCVQDAVRKWQIIPVYNIRCVCLLGFCLLATAEPFEKATRCFPNLAIIFLQLHRLAAVWISIKPALAEHLISQAERALR